MRRGIAVLIALILIAVAGVPAYAANDVPARKSEITAPTLTPESGLEIIDTSYGLMLCGLVAEVDAPAEGAGNRALGVTMQFSVPQGGRLEVLKANGRACPMDDIVGTGMMLLLVSTDNSHKLIDIVVRGDVTGDGFLKIGDLVVVANALKNPDSLTGACFLAVDMDNNGEIELTDLVMEAVLFKKGLQLDQGPSTKVTQFDPSIRQDKDNLIQYMVSHTFVNDDGDVLRFALNPATEHGPSMSAFINDVLDNGGWYYGRQYAGFSGGHRVEYDPDTGESMGGEHLIFSVETDGSFEYTDGHWYRPQ